VIRVLFACLLGAAMGGGGFAEAKVMKVLYKFPETTNAYGSFVVGGNGLMYGTRAPSAAARGSTT
jgi:hypothetical protein